MVDRESGKDIPAISGKKTQDIAETNNSAKKDAGEAQARDASHQQVEDYFSELRQWLAAHRRYPRRAQIRRQEGTAILEVELSANGQPRASEIARSSGYALLDQAARDMLERARPLPSPPPDMDVSGRLLRVPVDFALRSHH